jgi:predicted HicB family RNase H-like nuclease
METPKLKYASQQARVRRGLIPFQVWVTPTLRQRIKVAAARQETTMSDLAAEMLADALKSKKGAS